MPLVAQVFNTLTGFRDYPTDDDGEWVEIDEIYAENDDDPESELRASTVTWNGDILCLPLECLRIWI